MRAFNIYLNPKHFDYVLMHFIKPYFDLDSVDNKETSIVFHRYSSVDFPHLYFEISCADQVNKENQIENAWLLFIEKNPSIIFNEGNSIKNSIFKGYPIGYFKNKGETRHYRENFQEHGKVTSTSLKILESINNDVELRDEICLKALFVFIYSIGGYSRDRILALLEILFEHQDFSKKDQGDILKIVSLIFKQNGERLKSEIDKIQEELSTFFSNENFPSFISEWKFSYGILIENQEVHNPKISELYSLFKNQLNISDAESYSLLTILKSSLNPALL